MSKFDTSLRPGDDYFGYINNPWLSENPIPRTETSWGTFYVLRDASWKAVDNIITDLSRTPVNKLNHDQLLLRNFFTAALSSAKHATKQRQSVTHLLATIDAVGTKEDLAQTIGLLHRLDIGVFWTLYVSQDDKDNSNQVLRFYQAGLGLPNRDYYFDRSKRMAGFRNAYSEYYQTFSSTSHFLLGRWTPVWKLEKQLATASWTDIALRDVEKNYARLSQPSLKKRCPGFDWNAYWRGLGWQHPTNDIVIDQLSYIQASIKLLDSEPLENIKAYLKWSVANTFSSWTSPKLARLSFEFYGKTLSGQQVMKPLWKRAVLLADRLIIGEALGREYAKQYFPESSKKAVTKLVEDVRAAYHSRIDRLEWMGPATKERAHTKLDNIKVFVGYPSIWKDLSPLHFSEDNVIANLMAARAYNTDIELAKVGKKPAREEWEMNAHTVNAYNHPNRLEIVFPAAILQPPFYDPKASRAANLGGIGAVIGHELTHSFDDEGSKFDEHGNVAPWQTKEERKAFDKLAQNIVQLANKFETVPGVYLQGKLILGEAIADVGGLALAVEALGNKPAELEDLFVNFARCECGHTTKERALELAKIDPHPPSKFRVNNVVNHVDAFYETYGLKPSDKLYLAPEKRAKIW